MQGEPAMMNVRKDATPSRCSRPLMSVPGLVESAKLRETLANQERDQHGQGSKNGHKGMQAGSGATGANQRQAYCERLARELGSSDTSIHHWPKRAGRAWARSVPRQRASNRTRRRNRRLKRENEILR